MQKTIELFEKVAKDKDLHAKYLEIIESSGESGEDAAYKKLIDFAKDSGYDITVDEMQEYFNGIAASKEGELPDSELDKVAGGFVSGGPGFPFPFPIDPRFPFPGGPGLPPMSIIFQGSGQCDKLINR